MVPIVGFHFDEEIYPEPHKFDPERFAPEAIAGKEINAFGQYVAFDNMSNAILTFKLVSSTLTYKV